MSQGIEDLRGHLFATLEALRDTDKPMELDRARTIAEVAKTVIDTAKAENEFMKITGSSGSGFIPAKKIAALPAPHEQTPPGVLVHKIK